MKRRNHSLLLLAFTCLPLTGCGQPAQKEEEMVFERPPPVGRSRGHAWLLPKPALREAIVQLYGNASIRQVIDNQQSWPVEVGNFPVLTVAFHGGTPALHRQIADLASRWCADTSVTFDFDFNQQTGKYRLWNPATSASSSTAVIRIAFAKGQGHWSLVGQKALTEVSANQATMNFDGFTDALPSNWKHVVLHEFGHALGLLHELQHPEQKCELNWHNDPGYVVTRNANGTAIRDESQRRPGVLTVFASPPYGWSEPDIKTNLGILPADADVTTTPFDRESVMLYPLKPWLFNDASSPCAATDRDQLSTRDKLAIQTLYPKTQAGISALKLEKDRLAELLRVIEARRPK